MKQFNISQTYWYLGFYLACFAAIGSCLSIIGWYIPYRPLIYPLGSTFPLTYSTSLCLFLGSISVLFILFRRFTYGNLFGVLILLISGWRFLELLFNMDLGERNFFKSFVPNVTYPFYGMTELGCVTFTMFSLILIFWREKVDIFWSVVRLFFSQMLVVFSFIILLTYFFPVERLNFWYEPLHPLHIYNTFFFAILGFSLTATSIYYNLLDSIKLTKKYPILLLFILISMAIIMCDGMALNRREAIQKIIDSTGNITKDNILVDFNAIISALDRMVKRIEYRKTPPSEAWESDAKNFLDEYSEFDQILWVDRNFIVKNQVLKKCGNKDESDLFAISTSVKETLMRAIKEKKMYFSFRTNEGKRSSDIFIYAPVYWDEAFQGVVVSQIDFINFLKKNFTEDLQKIFFLTMEYEGNPILSSNPSNGLDEEVEFWSYEKDINLGTLHFKLILIPKSALFGGPLTKAWIYLIFLGGSLFSLAMGGILTLWGISQSQVSSLNTLRKELEDTQYNLSTSIQSAGIGAWIWDLRDNLLILDKQGQSLFGYEEGEFTGSLNELLERVHPNDRHSFENALKGLLEDQKKGAVKFNVRVILPSQFMRYIVGKGRVSLDKEQNFRKVFGSLWDETKVRFANERLEVSQNVIRSLSDSETIREAVAKVLVNLYNASGTEVIVIWFWNKKTMVLECAEVLSIPQVQTERFERVNRAIIGKDLTIPNQVVAIFGPIQVRNLKEYHQNFQIEPEKVDPDELTVEVAFPIFEGTTLIGVVELFKRSPYLMELDEGLEELLLSIGISMGEFIRKNDNKKLQEQLASIVTYSADALFLIDSEGYIKSWNGGAERIYGYLADEIVGKHVMILIAPEQKDLYESIRSIILSGRPVQHIQMKSFHKNGKLIWIQGSVAPIKDEHGKVVYGSVVIEDISLEKEVNYLLVQKEEKLHAFLETTQEWIWEMNVLLLYSYSNASVSKILGYSSEEMLNQNMLFFLFNDEVEKVKQELSDKIQDKFGWRKWLLRWKHKDGSERWLESTAKPIFDQTGALLGFRGSNLDVTENIRSDKVKSEFFSLISHELRSPLTSIHGTLGLLLQRLRVTDDMKELLKIAYRNSNRLSQLINNILDIQKMQSDKFSFNLLPVRLDKAINESIESEMLVATQDQKKLIVQEPIPPVIVNGDHERLIQLMGNLLSNAIKFTPKGSTITVFYEIRGNDIRISVKDEGKGIPKEFQSKIFQRFARAETGDARTTQGTGLGLSICKMIVEKLQGRIGFETEEGKGTVFYFELPILSI